MTAAASTSNLGQRGVIVVAAISGLFLLPFLSQATGLAKVINGFLVVLLIGIVLGNYTKWLPYVSGIHTPSPTTSIGFSGTRNQPPVTHPGRGSG